MILTILGGKHDTGPDNQFDKADVRNVCPDRENIFPDLIILITTWINTLSWPYVETESYKLAN